MTLRPGLALRPLTLEDLPAAHALTTFFGWPHRSDDWALMARLGEGVVATVDGILVGTAMGWRFGAQAASVGLIGVAPTAQGHGLGRRLMHAILAPLGDRVVILCATQAGLPLYRSLGFIDDGVVRQYQGQAPAIGVLASVEGEVLQPIGPQHFAAVAALDRAATRMQRDALLRGLLPESSGVVLERGGVVVGFALTRAFGRGRVIGPLVAPDRDDARRLITQIIGQSQGQFIRIDTPESAGLCDWLAAFGLADAGPGIRMVRGGPMPPQPGSPVTYGLASQAFG